MINDIKLYLCGMQVDFLTDPAIYYNFTLTDTTNPTAVKNSFSKTLQIEGTDNNNAIFGQIWDLSRFQSALSGNKAGTEFNPLKKADFELYYNGALYETGYFKLDNITKVRGKITYSITLYGGLGEFFYNLSYADNGEKKEFADVGIPMFEDTSDTEAVDIEFDITKETIKDAWDTINLEQTHENKFEIVNFAPAYNGIPENFDANKVLINQSGLTQYFSPASYNNFALGEASRELTEWETFDLRSYLQRPIVRVRSLIGACCMPENNGGFTVKLDSNFFNNKNPYYGDAWMTLPALKNNKDNKKETETEVTDGWLEPAKQYYTNTIWYLRTDTPFSDYNNLKLRVIPKFVPEESTTATTLYTSYYFKANNSFTLQKRFAKEHRREMAYLIQLRAYNNVHELVAASDFYQLLSEVKGGTNFAKYADSGYKVNTIYGYFKKVNGEYVWHDTNDNPVGLDFTLTTENDFTSVELYVKTPYYRYNKYTGSGGYNSEESGSDGGRYTYTKNYDYFNGNKDMNDVMVWRMVMGKPAEGVDTLSMVRREYADFFSGTHITKKDLLTLGITPSDFLLSYCKMFGLYFVKDSFEKKVTITDRTGFFDREKITDISDLIDYGSNIKILPSTADKKYYDFPAEQVDSEIANEYKAKYGQEYGLQRINTGYDFDSEVSKIYEGVFKGGIQCLESSPYYYKPFIESGKTVSAPVYIWNGFKWKRFFNTASGITSTEYTIVPVIRDYEPLNSRNEGFDLFDKLQLHGEGNEGIDGEFVLLFHNGNIDLTGLGSPTKYWITDDITEMATLNDKKPCWIMTNRANNGSKQIAIEATKIPYFTRQITPNNSSYITHSWDFGKPMETYIPNTYVSEGMSIYEKCWRNYMTDIYDINARKVTCNVLFKERLSIDSLRQFYWFENSHWIMTKVTDWNPAGSTTTLCEFVKIENLNDFFVNDITRNPIFDLRFPELILQKEEPEFKEKYYTIDSNAVNLRMDIRCDGNAQWWWSEGLDSSEYFSITAENGETYRLEYYLIVDNWHQTDLGNRSYLFRIPANTTGQDLTYMFQIMIDEGSEDNATVYLKQKAEGTHIPFNQIWYTSFDGSVINPDMDADWGVSLNKNTYTEEDGGILEFNGVVNAVPANGFSSEKDRIRTISLPNSINSINTAFSGVTNLHEIVIPKGLTTIGDYAFMGDVWLEGVGIFGEIETGVINIPNSVTEIGSHAFNLLSGFQNNGTITRINIGSSIGSGSGIERMHYTAFSHLGRLSDVYIYAETAPTLTGSGTLFNQCIGTNRKIHVPANAAGYLSWASHLYTGWTIVYDL